MRRIIYCHSEQAQSAVVEESPRIISTSLCESGKLKVEIRCRLRRKKYNFYYPQFHFPLSTFHSHDVLNSALKDSLWSYDNRSAHIAPAYGVRNSTFHFPHSTLILSTFHIPLLKKFYFFLKIIPISTQLLFIL